MPKRKECPRREDATKSLLFGTRPRPCKDREDREGEPADMRMADGASLESDKLAANRAVGRSAGNRSLWKTSCRRNELHPNVRHD